MGRQHNPLCFLAFRRPYQFLSDDQQSRDVADLNPAAFHLVRNTSLQADLQQAIFEGSASHLDVVCKVEAAFERAC